MDFKEEKKSRHEGDVCEKLAEKTQEIFAKEYDYSVFEIRDLIEHAHEIHELVAYLSGNQYYSDALAKKVFELKIDADLLVLKLERASLRDLFYVNAVEKSVLRGEKPKVAKQDVARLAGDLEALAKEVDGIYERAQAVVGEIKKEFKERGH